MTDTDPVRVVEAALFSAGKPLLEEELAEATGLKIKQVRHALGALSSEYADGPTALEVAKGGAKWAMQLKGRYSDRARKLARMEVPMKVLKTLALIAFHQPIRQSELKEMVGSVVYDHVKELHERGMVVARADGVTKILTTSPRFPEYFGLDATDRDGIRRLLAERVGLDIEKLDRERSAQSRLPADEDAEPDEDGLGDEPDEPAHSEHATAATEDAEGTSEPLKATTG